MEEAEEKAGRAVVRAVALAAARVSFSSRSASGSRSKRATHAVEDAVGRGSYAGLRSSGVRDGEVDRGGERDEARAGVPE